MKRISLRSAFDIFCKGGKVVFTANKNKSIVDGAFYGAADIRQHYINFTACEIEFAKMAGVETAKIRYYVTCRAV